METKHTDRDLLAKGLQIMGLTAVLMFIGPILIFIAFSNKEKPFYIPILILAIGICIFAVYNAFKGIKIIMDSMFNKK